MFTGIVKDVGRVRAIRAEGDYRLEIETSFETSTIPLGASVCCSGVCLTVVERGPGWFAVLVSPETLACTTIGEWNVDTRVNLERPLRLTDELGGHIVLGHIDGVARVESVVPDRGSRRLELQAPAHLARYIAPKGSVAVDGVSLTVNEVRRDCFTVNLIPHTLAVTALDGLVTGRRANLEIDMLARYVARLLEKE